MAQSQAEYNAEIDAAEAKIFAAQEALQRAETAYDDAVEAEASLNSQIAQAQQDLQNAQTAYDQSLIPDSSWIRPTVEETYTVEIPYTVQVPYVVQEPQTIQVATTETVVTTTIIPTTTYTMVGGITADVFNRLGYNNAPPLPSSTETPYATSTVSQINFQWGGGPVMNTNLGEDIIVRFTGNLMVPADGNYYFYAPADDGVILNIAGMGVIYDWRDKGGGGSQSQAVYIRAGILYPFTFYYYENGGGAWVQFYVRDDNSGYQIVPASWLGSQPQMVTTYETITTYVDVVTYHDEVIYNDVTYYRDETLYRQEERTRTVSDVNAVQPMIKDDSLLQTIVSSEVVLNNFISLKTQNSVIIESASKDVITAQEELRVAQQELEAIPPFREPTPTPSETESTTEEPTENVIQPTPEPEPSETPEPTEPELPIDVNTVDPETLSDKEVEELVTAAEAILATAEQGSPAYEQALQALAVAAIADDPQLPTELESIPGAQAVLETFNALGNIGADMAPQVREDAEKTIIASVIATGAAVQATVAAATTASMTTSSSGSSGSGGGGASSESKSGGRTNRKVK